MNGTRRAFARVLVLGLLLGAAACGGGGGDEDDKDDDRENTNLPPGNWNSSTWDDFKWR